MFQHYPGISRFAIDVESQLPGNEHTEFQLGGTLHDGIFPRTGDGEFRAECEFRQREREELGGDGIPRRGYKIPAVRMTSHNGPTGPNGEVDLRGAASPLPVREEARSVQRIEIP